MLVTDDHLTPPFFDPVIHSLSIFCAHTLRIDHQTLNTVGVVTIDCNDCHINMRPSASDQSPTHLASADIKVTGDNW